MLERLESSITAFCTRWINYGQAEKPIGKRYPWPDELLAHAKVTYGFADPNNPDRPYSEPALEAFADPKHGLIVHPDKSVTFFVDADDTAVTPNGSAPRVGLRFYLDMPTKTSWSFNKDFTMPEHGFMLNSIPEDHNMYFGQLHGESSKAILKNDCGKDEFRSHIAKEFNGGRSVLKSGQEPIAGKKYTQTYGRKNGGDTVFVKISDVDGNVYMNRETDGFSRTDDYWPQIDCYGSTGFSGSITYFSV